MYNIYNSITSDKYLDIVTKEYKAFRNTSLWDEKYKWDILFDLNSSLNLKEVNEENVNEVVGRLVKANPSEGPLVYWKVLSNFGDIARKNPERVVSFFQTLLDESLPIAERIDTAKNILSESMMAVSVPFLSYILASHDMKTYPIYKDSIFRHFWDILGEKWNFGYKMGEKYQTYCDTCTALAKYLQEMDVVGDADVMNGQDFMYCIFAYDELKMRIAAAVFQSVYETSFKNSAHAQLESEIYDQVSLERLGGLSKEDFIKFFFSFIKDGGGIQGGDHWAASKFLREAESYYPEFREHVMNVFSKDDLDVVSWFDRGDSFKYFGKSIRSILLHVVYPDEYPIWNNRTDDALDKLGLLPSKEKGMTQGEYYLLIRDIEKRLTAMHPGYNLFVVDALLHHMIKSGIEEPKPPVGIFYDAPMEISAEQWESALKDPTVTNAEIFSLLRLLYRSPNHEMRSSDIAHALELSHHIEVNKLVAGFGKRVIAHTGAEPPLREDHSVRWWHVPFLGYDKNGASPWILRPELAEALGAVLEEGYEPDRTVPATYGTYLEQLQMMPENDIPLSLYFEDPETLLRQIRTALRAGKHIILSGPPGTGKSKLAKAICRAMRGKENYAMVTACSDWSTFDTIGGYMPNGDQKLVFEKGVFLSCFQEDDGSPANRWLVIDEINRADIDKAFGALFSALTKDKIELSQTVDGKRIELVGNPREDDAVLSHRFFIHPDWRIIATMNTLDKASLYEMSYAFMRRFAFINVGIPEDIPRAVRELASVWRAPFADENEADTIAGLWESVNARRKIGPAIVEDILSFVRTEGDYASAIAMYVFPQFEGLADQDIVGFVKDSKDRLPLSRRESDRLCAAACDFFNIKRERFNNV